MPYPITRRKLAALAVLAPAALAQPAPAPLPANPEEELTAARAQVRQTSDLLAKVELANAVEPACHFKA